MADYVVLETGLGGTYDPTNIIKKPLCSVITNIGLDHTKVLGDTIEKIAEAKAGIIKKKVPVIVYPSDTDALKVIKRKAKEIGAPCLVISNDMVGITNNLNDTEFVYKDKNYKIPLLGFYQAFNAILAIEACNVVLGAKTRSSKLSEEQKAKIIKYIDKCIVKGLRECAWEGRLEKLSDAPLVFVDGGHNPQCIDYITDYFNNAYPYHEKIYISGFLKDKDYKYMIKTLASSASALYLVKVNNPRSLSYEELSAEVSELEIPAHAFESIEAAYKKAKVEIQKYEENGIKSLICFVGSLYQLNDVYKAVKGSDNK